MRSFHSGSSPTHEGGVGLLHDAKHLGAGPFPGAVIIRDVTGLLQTGKSIGNILQVRHGLFVMAEEFQVSDYVRSSFHFAVLETPGEARTLGIVLPITNRFPINKLNSA